MSKPIMTYENFRLLYAELYDENDEYKSLDTYKETWESSTEDQKFNLMRNIIDAHFSRFKSGEITPDRFIEIINKIIP